MCDSTISRCCWLLGLAAVLPACLAMEDSRRVIGGISTDIRDHPYMASLRNQGLHDCSATIIDRVWALTAAHCVANWTVNNLSLRVGSSHLTGPGGRYHRIIEVVIHPDFDLETEAYDIALVKVRRPFKLDWSVQTIPLVESNYHVPFGRNATLTGWGWTKDPENKCATQHDEDEDSMANTLQAVSVPLVSNVDCEAAYGLRGRIQRHMLCAGYKHGASTCTGDSGGPLVVSARLVGIVSHADYCDKRGIPAVYMSILYFRNWIRDVSGV